MGESPEPSAGRGDLRLLEVDLETCFVLADGRCIERENDPGGSRGPSVAFAGCEEGNVFAIHADVGPAARAAILALAACETGWRGDALPACVPKIVDLLAAEAPAPTVVPGLIYALPRGARFAHGARIVRGGEAAGEALVERLARQGLPRSLLDMGFVGVEDFWAPWCAATVDGEIASIAFAARLGEAGAEIGVATRPEFRGRGLAAAVTAAWSALPRLANRALFYSTQATNLSSRRVTSRLGLRLIGRSVRVG
jgi:GNAT superfamily N-acetyltransferase